MTQARRSGRRRAATLAAAMAAGGAGVLLVAAPAISGSDTVSGRLTSVAVPGPDCRSPVGWCAHGELKGRLKGTWTFTANSATATVDTPTTSVVVYTGDVAITTREGTLTCKEAGTLATSIDRSYASLCTVTAATGEYAGKTGHLRFSGIAPEHSGDGPGEAVFQGTLIGP